VLRQVVLCLHDRDDAAACNAHTLRVGAQLALVRNKPKCSEVASVLKPHALSHL
jgi:hypothetical protein